MADLIQEITNLKNLKERLDFKKDELKEIQKAYDVMRLETIPQMCEEAGVEGMKVEGVGSLILTGDMYVNIPAASREDTHTWLRDMGYGDLIKETVNSSTLKSWAKGMVERGDDLPDEEMIKMTPFTRASIRKA